MTAQKPRSDEQLLEIYRKEAESIRLRTAGHTFQAIADQVGYADASGALRAYRSGMARAKADVDLAADERKELIRGQLDRLLRVLEAKIDDGDTDAVRTANLIIKGIRELDGMDSPTKFTAETMVHIRISGADDV